jgi:hypothetical protein
MSDTYTKLAQHDLDLVDAAPTAVVTAGGTEQVIVKHIRVVNQSTLTIAGIRMWQRTSAGVPVDDELILPTADIAAGGWAEFEGTIILNPSEVLYADSVIPTSGPGTSMTITLYGLKMTP